MERNDPRYQAYVEILKEELIPAMGCTEPIALARHYRRFRREGAGSHLGGQRGKEVCHPGLSADSTHHHRAHRAGACV